MVIAGILAGGIGSRMGSTHLPKQFLCISEKPVIIYTLEQFYYCNDIDYIVIGVPKDFIDYTNNLIKDYFKREVNKFIVISGGTDRNSTINNICTYVNDNLSSNANDIIVTHDAVRPFVTQRIIKDNIDMIMQSNVDAVDTVIPAYDTIVQVKDNDEISDIPLRDKLRIGQTPQTFRVQDFINIYKNINCENLVGITDAIKVFKISNKLCKCVRGESYNIKITDPTDIVFANAILNLEGKNDKPSI